MAHPIPYSLAFRAASLAALILRHDRHSGLVASSASVTTRSMWRFLQRSVNGLPLPSNCRSGRQNVARKPSQVRL